MEIKKIKKNILQFIGLRFAVFFVDMLCKSLRINIENNSRLTNEDKFIAAFWHGKMIAPWYILRKYKISGIVSQSKDGEILSRLLTKWNYEMIRGSSSTGGKDALKLMEEKIDQGFSVAITPDGPRGPEKEMKPGTVVLAKRTGLPIYFLSVKYFNKINLKSWDKFQIPLPFSKVNIKIEESITINVNLNYNETSKNIKFVSLLFRKFDNEIETCLN